MNLKFVSRTHTDLIRRKLLYVVLPKSMLGMVIDSPDGFLFFVWDLRRNRYPDKMSSASGFFYAGEDLVDVIESVVEGPASVVDACANDDMLQVLAGLQIGRLYDLGGLDQHHPRIHMDLPIGRQLGCQSEVRVRNDHRFGLWFDLQGPFGLGHFNMDHRPRSSGHCRLTGRQT